MAGLRCHSARRTLACASLLALLAVRGLAQERPRPEEHLPATGAAALEAQIQAPESLALEAEAQALPFGSPVLEPESPGLELESAEAWEEGAEADAPLDLPSLDEVAPRSDDAAPLPEIDVRAETAGLPLMADRETLRRYAISEPRALGPLSIGTPNGGLLFNPVPMPQGTLWSVRNPRDSFGTVETIGFIETAVTTVETMFPGSPRLVVSDISRADGGRLDRHKSHQAGRDADIGFYYRTGEATILQPARKATLDLPRTWTLLRAFITRTDVERVFLDRQVQRLLYDHALAQGEDREWLDHLFGRQGMDALVQHERGHLDHMHVRFYNPEAQEHGRLAYPVLVEAGLLPGPMIRHRVARGETLSHLARRYGTSPAVIRSANGLRSSSLRAGRTYVIPVRKIPSPGEPVVIPPRRLPPLDPPVEAGPGAGSDSSRY